MNKSGYVIIQTGGRQYRVAEGEEIIVDRLNKPPGSQLRLSPLLLVGKNNRLYVGKPEVKNAQVKVKVLDHILGKKIYVSTYKAKTRYRRKIGFRPKLTRLMIEKIKVSE